jgi:P4 family phage/plasmid primase-like protien
MLKLARSLRGVAIDAAKFDSDPRALHVANGVVVLGRSGATFRARLHSDFATFSAPVPFVEGATSKVWDKFLADVLPDPDHRHWVQTLFGYTLYGGNPERAFILAKGKSSAGKSTMAEAIHATLGDYGNTYEASLFRGGADQGPRADIVDALPKRFLYCLEGSEAVPWHADVIKRATGNDRVRARALHSNTFVERKPAFTPWLFANAYPNVPNSDQALRRRIFAAPYLATILAVDGFIEEKLRDPVVQAAILAWLVAGWDIYCAEGLQSPSGLAMDARQDAINTMSLFDEWLNECCEEGPEAEGYLAPAEALRESWSMWLADAGHDEPKWCTRQWFGAKMSGHGFDVRTLRVGDRTEDKKIRHRTGVRLLGR